MGITIRSVEFYHPQNRVGNDYYEEHFKEDKEKLDELLETLGRKQRYISDRNDENSLTMPIKAVAKLMKKNHLKGTDIDMVIFSSDTPEFLIPPNAVKIHASIKGKTDAIAYDMNANCVGMVIALDHIGRYMAYNKNINRVLLVGAQQLSKHAKEDNMVSYIAFGDAAAAVLIERTEYDSGIIDSGYFLDSTFENTILMPEKGFSNREYNGLPKKDMEWTPFDTDKAFESAVESIENILKENNLSKKQVKKYFLSQFAKKNIDFLRKELKEEEQKFEYIGDVYGYTGTTSPFVALANSIKKGELKKGDIIVFWSVGAGVNACNVVFKM